MAASYTTPTKVKATGRLGISGVSYDTVLTELCESASRWIDRYAADGLEDAFSASAEATRYYSVDGLYEGGLMLDAPLLSLSSLTNGDSTAIPTSEVILMPRNSSHFRKLLLKSTQTWSFLLDGEIAVTGVWGLFASGSTPSPVVEAASILASWMFKRYQTALQDATAVPELGQLVYSDGVPKQVLTLLLPYRSSVKV